VAGGESLSSISTLKSGWRRRGTVAGRKGGQEEEEDGEREGSASVFELHKLRSSLELTRNKESRAPGASGGLGARNEGKSSLGGYRELEGGTHEGRELKGGRRSGSRSIPSSFPRAPLPLPLPFLESSSAQRKHVNSLSLSQYSSSPGLTSIGRESSSRS